jgi:NADH-quinone oxidoreductase subunit C
MLMDNAQLENSIRIMESLAEIKTGKQFIEVNVNPSSLHKLAQTLRDSDETLFDFLICLTGVDFGQNLGVVYHLRSTIHNHTIVLKALVADRQSPRIDSVSDIWASAEFFENEIFDLLGINFNNHPDPRRLFMEEGYGFPLRKDFSDEKNIVTK